MSQLTCRSCAAPLRTTVCDLGASPLANSYLKPEQLQRPEQFWSLVAWFCDQCKLVQLPTMDGTEHIFSDYAYFSSFSDSWLEHARLYFESARDRFALNEDSLVVEVASNDGYLLRNAVAAEIPCFGIEPARNIAEHAEQAGISTVNRFLGKSVAEAAVSGTLDPTVDVHGGSFASSAKPLLGRGADLVVANNVFAHVPDLNDFTAGLATLLAPAGVLTIEVQHLLTLLEHVQFDTIYHEHYQYYSLHAAQSVLANHGLEVFDVELLATHGGSLRIYARRDDAPLDAAERHLATTENVEQVLGQERSAGLLEAETYSSFEQRVQGVKRGLLRFLMDAAERGETVVGYGAPAKGNTLLNYCGIGTDLVAYTVDRNPHKQGCFLPGTRIPIASPERIRETQPDWVLILPWNLEAEIAEQMAHIRDWGGRFLVAIPEVHEIR